MDSFPTNYAGYSERSKLAIQKIQIRLSRMQGFMIWTIQERRDHASHTRDMVIDALKEAEQERWDFMNITRFESLSGLVWLRYSLSARNCCSLGGSLV